MSSVESSWRCCCAASAREASRKNAASRIVVRRMGFLLRKSIGSREKMEPGLFEEVCRCSSAKSTRKIVVQVGFEGEVRTELMNLDILQELGRELWRERVRRRHFATCAPWLRKAARR